MPYGIRKAGKRWKVYKRTTGKALPGSSASKGIAEKRVRAINANEHSGKRSNRYKAG